MHITDSQKVAMHYLTTGDCAADLLCYFPYAWFGYAIPASEVNASYVRLLPLTRLLRAAVRLLVCLRRLRMHSRVRR